MVCKKIDCILPGRSQYHALHHFTLKISEALKRAGHKVRLLSVEECVSSCSQEPPDMTVGFNGAPQVVKDLFLCDVIEVPHTALLVDPPYYYLELLESPFINLFCDDETNINVLKSFGYSNASFLTQGVEPELIEESAIEKEYDTVFFASYFKGVMKEFLTHLHVMRYLSPMQTLTFMNIFRTQNSFSCIRLMNCTYLRKKFFTI